MGLKDQRSQERISRHCEEEAVRVFFQEMEGGKGTQSTGDGMPQDRLRPKGQPSEGR